MPKNEEEVKPVRTADPMAFSSILSSNTSEPSRVAAKHNLSSKQHHKAAKISNGDVPSPSPEPNTVVTLRKPPHKASSSPKPNHVFKERPKEDNKGSVAIDRLTADLSTSTSEKENEKVRKAMADIDAMEVSDVDCPGWEKAKEQYRQAGRKRMAAAEENEAGRRKVSLVEDSRQR